MGCQDKTQSKRHLSSFHCFVAFKLYKHVMKTWIYFHDENNESSRLSPDLNSLCVVDHI